MVIGILLAQIINYLIAEKVPENASRDFILNSWNGQTGWRWMFWAETFAALAFLVLAFFIPESPRFLVKSGQKCSALLKVLERIGGRSYAAEQVKPHCGNTHRQFLKGELESTEKNPGTGPC